MHKKNEQQGGVEIKLKQHLGNVEKQRSALWCKMKILNCQRIGE